MKETKFKNTEIGMIPEDWKTCTVLSQSSKLVVAFVGTCEKYYTNKGEGVMMLRTGDLKEHSIDYTNIKYISYSFHNANKKSQLKKGDILIARHGSNGHGVIYDKNDEANSLNFVIVHLIDKEYLNSYLVYCLDTNIVREQIEAVTAGSTQKVINTKAIGELVVPKPNILEQQKIASALTSIDNLISSLGRLIEKKKNVKQGTMQQLLTGKTRLKGFSEPWVEKIISDIATTSSGGTPSRNIPNYYNGKIKWFTTSELQDNYLYDSVEHITKEALNKSSAKVFPMNTILMAMYGATIGKLGILKEDSATNQACCAIICNNIDEIFLFYVLLYNRKSIIERGCGAGQPNISQKIVNNLSFLVPNSLAEQRAIASILTKMDDEITALEAKKTKYEAVKQGMMQQLLTGKIRLIG